MKKSIFISLIFLLAFASCKKDNQQPSNGNGNSGGNTNPPPVTTGTLYFQNTQTDPYILYLDGTNIGILAAGSPSSGYTVTSGISHAVKAEQASGYILYPTIFTGTATVNPAGSVTWQF